MISSSVNVLPVCPYSTLKCRIAQQPDDRPLCIEVADVAEAARRDLPTVCRERFALSFPMESGDIPFHLFEKCAHREQAVAHKQHAGIVLGEPLGKPERGCA